MSHYEVVVGFHRRKRILLTLDPAHGWRQNSIDGFLNEWEPATGLLLVFMGKAGRPPRPGPVTAPSEAGSTGSGATLHEDPISNTTVQPRVGLHRATRLVGMNIETPQGEALGKIEDIVLDPGNGRISSVIVSFGGFLGMGSKLAAIPVTAFTFDEATRKFLLNIDKEVLRNAPAFGRDDWPELIDRVLGGRRLFLLRPSPLLALGGEGPGTERPAPPFDAAGRPPVTFVPSVRQRRSGGQIPPSGARSPSSNPSRSPPRR